MHEPFRKLEVSSKSDDIKRDKIVDNLRPAEVGVFLISLDGALCLWLQSYVTSVGII
jgi:hypothetical protein